MAADQTFSWDYGKSHDSHEPELPKSIPPQGFNITEKQDCTSETWHITFRAFTSSEGSDPIEGLQSLRELCHLWLRPDIHTKEQILDKLVIEQFMISMPQELQVLVKESGVDSCKDLEDMLRNNVKPTNWVSRNFMISLGKGENVGGCKVELDGCKRASGVYSRSMVLTWERVFPSWDPWHYLETILAVINGEERGCYGKETGTDGVYATVTQSSCVVGQWS